MDNDTFEYRLNKVEKEVDNIKEDIKPMSEFKISINNLTNQINKLSEQFERFSNKSNERNYDWLKYFITLFIGAVFTYLIAK